MLSYAPVDRDRERLVEELAAARQFTATSLFRAPAVRRRLFRGRLALRSIIRSHHPVGA